MHIVRGNARMYRLTTYMMELIKQDETRNHVRAFTRVIEDEFRLVLSSHFNSESVVVDYGLWTIIHSTWLRIPDEHKNRICDDWELCFGPLPPARPVTLG